MWSFCVVGGAIVLSPNEAIIQEIGKVYAGRASASPIIDLFITLLSMGLNGYKELLRKRTNMLESFATRLHELAEKHGERLLQCSANTISFGITIDQIARPKTDGENDDEYVRSVSADVSKFGAMLFSRYVETVVDGDQLVHNLILFHSVSSFLSL